MGRKKRPVHPWSGQDLALAECAKALGQDATREAVECFRTVLQDGSEYAPNSDQFIRWMADLLSAVERKYDVRVSGGLATLLWISAGARPLTSEDRFDRSRKTWDEAIRSARKREHLGGPGLFDLPVASFHGAMTRGARIRRGRPKPSLDRVRAFLEYELEELRRAAQRLSLRDVSALLRKIQRLRTSMRSGPRH